MLLTANWWFLVSHPRTMLSNFLNCSMHFPVRISRNKQKKSKKLIFWEIANQAYYINHPEIIFSRYDMFKCRIAGAAGTQGSFMILLTVLVVLKLFSWWIQWNSKGMHSIIFIQPSHQVEWNQKTNLTPHFYVITASEPHYFSKML